MASSVKVNIPGIGTVEAENAASEATLLSILAAVQKSEATKKKEEKSNAAELKKQQDAQKKAADEWEKSLKGMTEEERKAAVTKKKRESERKQGWEEFKTGSAAAGKELMGAFGSIAKSAVSVGAAFVSTYDSMAKDPIGAGAALVNVGIDAANTAVHGVTNAVSAVGASIPVFGGFIVAASNAAAGLSDALAAAAKTANDVMAKEFQKSSTALKAYTQAGASFAGGMDEMRGIANDAGLSMETLQQAATKSSQSLRETGLSQGEATKVLAAGMGAAAKATKNGGASMRDQMLALGYSYEEQGEIMAQFMAQQRSAGANLKNIAPEELARGTREYATNLKVISDITGEDAKKLMAKAREESMQAGVFSEVMKKGGPEAVKKLQNQLATMPEGLKKAYLEKLSLGKVVDAASNVYLNANEKAAEQLGNMSNDLYNSGVSAADATKNAGIYSEQTGKYALEHADKMAAIGKASIAGVGGIAKDTADMSNKMTMDALKRQEGTSEASADAAKKQADLADKAGSVEQSFAKISTNAQNFAADMEKFTGSHLGDYAVILADAFKATADAVRSGVDVLTRKSSAPVSKGEEISPGAGFSYEDLGLPSMADGGIVNGPKSGFLSILHGNEAVIPLDGISSATVTDLAQAKNTDNDSLTAKLDRLIGLMEQSMTGATTVGATAGGDSIADAFNGLQDMLAKQLDIHTEMNSHARDNKDLMQKLLNVSM